MATAKKYQAWKQSLHNNLEAKKLQDRTLDPEQAKDMLSSMTESE
jgi:hypothetical protein